MVAEPNNTSELTAAQEKAIIALLNEATVTRAAEVAGVNQATLHRWLNDETFGDAYRKARREAYGQAIALTQRYAALAVNTLAQVMMNNGATSSARVSAASALLKFGREGIELDDLAIRIEALERTVNDDRGRSWRR